ncbi:MAG: DinB family protein [Candidatus Eisenbacteria bacterium]
MDALQRTIFIDHARGIRDLTILAAARFTSEDAYRIPHRCGNCPIWNIGHVLVVQEDLLLRPFGERGVLPATYGELFGEGTCSCEWNGNRPDWDEVVSLLDPVRARVEEFIEEGLDLRRPLPEPHLTAAGIVLGNLADSLSFSTLHEAIHLGVLTTYARLLGGSGPINSGASRR